MTDLVKHLAVDTARRRPDLVIKLLVIALAAFGAMILVKRILRTRDSGYGAAAESDTGESSLAQPAVASSAG